MEQNKSKHLDTVFEQLIESNATVLFMLHIFSDSSDSYKRYLKYLIIIRLEHIIFYANVHNVPTK